MQSPSLAQCAWQLSPVGLHLVVPLAQLTAAPFAQVPLLLHAAGVTLAGVLPLPAVHTDGQAVPPPGYVHAAVFTPLHEPSHMGCIGSELHAGRGATGAPVTGLHMPSKPGRLHAWHWPPQAALQQ